MNFKPYYDKALTYEQYESHLGDNLALHRLHYNKFKVSGSEEQEFKGIKPLKILVLTEPWCGDSLAIFPVVRRLAEINGTWEMKILLRDENLDLMDRYLTRGGRAVPLFFFLSDDYSLIFKWGPRPAATQQIFEQHRRQLEQGTIDKMEVIKKIRGFYAKDRGKAILSNLTAAFRENRLL